MAAGKIFFAFGGAGLIGFTLSTRHVPNGHVGLKDFFGVVSDEVLDPGLHLVMPLTKVRLLSIQKQSYPFESRNLSSDGLSVNMAGSVIYQLQKEKVVDLYRKVGLDFLNILLRPYTTSTIRNITAGNTGTSLYSSGRAMIEKGLLENLNKAVHPDGIAIIDTPLQSIYLPDSLTRSIEQKLAMEQENQKMDFIIEKERKTAQRREIEAQGIARFQEIVSKGIDAKLLQWKGIEATKELATSTNSKVVIVGGKDGLPLIFSEAK